MNYISKVTFPTLPYSHSTQSDEVPSVTTELSMPLHQQTELVIVSVLFHSAETKGCF